MVSAYDYDTHSLVTDHAYRDSVLNPQTANSIVPVLGFDRLDKDYPFSFTATGGAVAPDGVAYFDEAAVQNPAVNLPPSPGSGTTLAYRRYPQQQERNSFDDLVGGNYIEGPTGESAEERVRSWLVRGTVREDDNDGRILLSHGFWITSDERDKDPFGYIFRAAKHFYDPIYNRAFDFETTCNAYTCIPSINWSLGRTNPLDPASDSEDLNRRNHFTWQDARNNYWWALTLKRDYGSRIASGLSSSQERLQRWASTLNDLGHVVHLLQDAAQPQHVRNDSHAPPRITSVFLPGEGPADGAFEDYTEYRVHRDFDAATDNPILGVGNSLLEMDETLPPVAALPRIVLGDSNYYPGNGAHVQFAAPVEFFTTRHIESGGDNASVMTRRGLADFANRSFFTIGTLPGFRECEPPQNASCVPTATPTYSLPPNDLGSPGYSASQFDSGLRVNGRVVFLGEYAYPITDAISPAYDASLGELTAYAGKAPLVTKAQWTDLIPDDLRTQYLTSVGYTMSYNNMRYMADVMLPRAVGYTAGMIDYFFRGRLDVETTRSGVLAVLNQGSTHSMNAYGYPCNGSAASDNCGIFGFNHLRLRVHNTTPDITVSGTGSVVPQAMASTTSGSLANSNFTGPYLVAIARYHRNACYTPALGGIPIQTASGTITNPAPSCAAGSIRTPYQEVSVSNSAAIDAATLNGTSAADVEFDFGNDPIPVNATDLIIQVVYRGPLGQESDGIAVGSLDIAEPTFAAFWNNTDYFVGSNGDWVHDTSYPYLTWGIGTSIVCTALNQELFHMDVSDTNDPADILTAPSPDNPGAVRLGLLLQPAPAYNGSVILQGFGLIHSNSLDHQPTLYFDNEVVPVLQQANVENISDSALVNPMASCDVGTPNASSPCWRSDPVQQRRGVVWGSVWWPFHLNVNAPSFGFPDEDVPPDVDSAALPAFTTAAVRSGGVVTFNNIAGPGACRIP